MKESTTLGRIAALCSLLLASLLLLGAVALIEPAATWLRNWLVILFELNAGLGGVGPESLRGLKLLDLAVLALAGLGFLGFWPGPGKPRRLGLSFAAALPFAGIGLVLATGLSGRSGLMGGGLVLSLLLFAAPGSKPLALLGLVAQGLLLAGDLGTTGSPAPLTAAAIGLGYPLSTLWFILIALRLGFRPQARA